MHGMLNNVRELALAQMRMAIFQTLLSQIDAMELSTSMLKDRSLVRQSQDSSKPLYLL